MAFKLKGFNAGKGTGSSAAFPKSTPKKQNIDPDVIGGVDQAMDYQKYYGQTKSGSGPDTDKRVIVGEDEYNYLMSQPGNEEFKKRLAANRGGLKEGERMVYEQYGYEDRGGDEPTEFGEVFGARSRPGSEYTYQKPGEGPRGTVSTQTHFGSGGNRDFDKWVRSGVSKFNMPRLKPEEVESISSGKKEELTLPERKNKLKGSADIDMQIMDRINKPQGELSFGDAFRRARSGEGYDGVPQATFEWQGKKYHSRRADESKADWQKKFKTTKSSPGKEPVKVKSKVEKKPKIKVETKVKTKSKDKDKDKVKFPFGRKE